jgi:hypothetical protein
MWEMKMYYLESRRSEISYMKYVNERWNGLNWLIYLVAGLCDCSDDHFGLVITGYLLIGRRQVTVDMSMIHVHSKLFFICQSSFHSDLFLCLFVLVKQCVPSSPFASQKCKNISNAQLILIGLFHAFVWSRRGVPEKIFGRVVWLRCGDVVWWWIAAHAPPAWLASVALSRQRCWTTGQSQGVCGKGGLFRVQLHVWSQFQCFIIHCSHHVQSEWSGSGKWTGKLGVMVGAWGVVKIDGDCSVWQNTGRALTLLSYN